MPRDAFSNYTLPVGNPVITGTSIASSWANTTMSDIATALTQSLSTDGSTATVNLINKTMNNGAFGFATITSSTLNAATIQGASTFNGVSVVTSGSATIGTGLTVGNGFTVTAGSATFGAGVGINGLLNLTGTGSAGQILFPPTQNSSLNPNCLDDYEEGTWTPVYTCVSPGNLVVGYGVRSGTYTKIGRMVLVNLDLVVNPGYSTASGDLRITGLPFTTITTCAAPIMLIGFQQGGTGRSYAVAYMNAGNFFFNIRLVALNVGDGPASVDATIGNLVSGGSGQMNVSMMFQTN